MKPKTKSELMAEWASQPDQLKKEREAKAVCKALAEAEAQGCRSVEEYRRLRPISSGRNLRVDRTEPSGNDFLKNAGRRRPLKKKGASECDDGSA